MGSTSITGHASSENESRASDELLRTVRHLVIRVVGEPKTAAEVAAELDVTMPQAEVWLKRLVEEGRLEKTKKPIRYSVRETGLSNVEDHMGQNADIKTERSEE